MPLAFLEGRHAVVTWSYAFNDGSLRGFGPVRVWDANTGRVLQIGESDHSLSGGDVSKSGQWIAVSDTRVESAVQIHDSRTGEKRIELPRSIAKSIVKGIAFSPDERRLALIERTSAESRVSVWDIQSKHEIVAVPHSGLIPTNFYGFGLQLLKWSPDGELVAIAESGDREAPGTPKIHLARVNSGQLLRSFAGPERSALLETQFSPDSRYFAAAFSTPNRPVFAANCWGVENGDETLHVEGDVAQIRPHGPWVIDWGRGTAPKRVRVFGFADPNPQFEFPLGPDEGVSGGLAFDHRTIALSLRGSDRLTEWLMARGWSIPWRPEEYWHACFVDGPTRREIGRLTPIRLPKGDSNATWAEFSPDGKVFAFNDGRMLRMYDLPPHKPLAWFFTGTALIALPIALLAWRRTRKLRAA
jgi:WD40 repeat protein